MFIYASFSESFLQVDWQNVTSVKRLGLKMELARS